MTESSFAIEFTRFYLAAFFTFVAGFYTIRIIVKKRSGIKEVVFPGPYLSASWWNHMLFRFFRAAIWMVCVVRAVFPSLDGYLGVCSFLFVTPYVVAGTLLLTFGFGLAVTVHMKMGRQWRSGIAPQEPENLTTDGLYRYSRNPMFVGVGLAQIGFFFALPSIFTAVCLVVGLYALRSQTLEEETHLQARFKQDYLQYKSRVRRWV
ncbi:methyltransferase family protein [Corallincola platygyrae]|uniref:Methyltransferase family protein n=1 Tax=Corallincola platygyrae TaxID=1193278 RepID=A0ABW4XGB3_9GAMM